MNKREVGAIKEQLAVTFLRQQGVRISAVNFRIRQGEIDLIGYDGAYLVFFEVKYRRSENFGSPLEAVGQEKIRRIYRTAQHYLKTRNIDLQQPCRFDVIGIQGYQIVHIENAFGGM